MVFCYQNCSDLLIFGNRIHTLTFSWRFLKSNKLEQLEFKLEKIIGI